MIEIIPNWHPILVHFTVALFSIAGILFVISIVAHGWQQRETALLVAKWNFWIGTALTVLTVIAGWDAFNSVAHDAASHQTMTTHSIWAIATVTAVLIMAGWLFLAKEGRVGFAFLIPVIVMLGLLGTTAWYGGEAVYRHGLGVMSLPKASGDGHDHDHGDGHSHGSEKQDSKKAGAHHDSIDEKEEHDHSTHKH